MRAADMQIDSHSVVRGLWLGPFLLVFGSYGIRLIWQLLDAKLTASSGYLMMAGILVFPTGAMLGAASVSAMRRSGPARWLFMALGAAVSTVAIVATVAGATGLIAFAMSMS
jgi:hypothetical protein